MSTRWGQPREQCLFGAVSFLEEIALKNHAFLCNNVSIDLSKDGLWLETYMICTVKSAMGVVFQKTYLDLVSAV